MLSKKNPYNTEKLLEAFRRQSQKPITVEKIARTMGVTEVYVYKILSGEKYYAPAVEKVADILGVPMEELKK